MLKRRTILLAEDSPKDAELTLAALSESQVPHEVVVSRDGAEALDYLYCRGQFSGRASGNPVLILLDLKMPKVDGLEVLNAVKSDDRLKLIPVVMLTSSREERDLLQSYGLGANAYVVKPVSFEVFVQAMKDTGNFWGLINEPPPTS